MISNKTNYDQIRLTIINWLQQYSVIPTNQIYWSNEPESKTAWPFATVLEIDTDEEYGLPIRNDVFTQGVGLQTQYLTLRSFKIQLDIYSDVYANLLAQSLPTIEANEILRDILATIRSDAVKTLFSSNGFTLLRHNTIVRMDEIVDARWQRHSVTDLTFLYQENIFDDGADQSWIDAVQIGINGLPNPNSQIQLSVNNGNTIIPPNQFGQCIFSNRNNTRLVTVI